LDLKEKPEIVLSEKEHKNFSWVTKDESFLMSLILDEDYCIKDFYEIK
jgi:hypothetical protein